MNDLKEWMNAPDMLCETRGSLTMHLLPSPFRNDLVAALDRIDDVIASGRMKKDSKNVQASIVELNGREFFFKRTNNKGLRHTFRYLFRPARSYRAAYAAERLRAAGLPTPRVWAAGERKRGPYLIGSYLVTEALSGVRPASDFLSDDPKAAESPERILKAAGRLLRGLHSDGFYHGDLKLSNLYLENRERLGFWDLDSVRIFPQEPPRKWILRDLGRVLSSFLIEFDRNPAADAGIFDVAELASCLCLAYGAAHAVDPDDVIAVARERWLSKCELRHSLGGMP